MRSTPEQTVALCCKTEAIGKILLLGDEGKRRRRRRLEKQRCIAVFRASSNCCQNARDCQSRQSAVAKLYRYTWPRLEQHITMISGSAARTFFLRLIASARIKFVLLRFLKVSVGTRRRNRFCGGLERLKVAVWLRFCNVFAVWKVLSADIRWKIISVQIAPVENRFRRKMEETHCEI